MSGNTSSEPSNALQTVSPPPTTTISPRATDALKNVEDSVGGRQGLINTLIVAQLDDKQQHFLRILVDPARANDSLAKICKDALLKPSELIEMYRKASFALAAAVATGKAANAIPAVVDDIAMKSVDRQVVCWSCKGKVKDNHGNVCQPCGGNGTILVESDHDRQKTLLDMLGLGKKPSSGATIINTNAQINQGNVGSLFSSFVKATDKAAYDIKVDAVDAEVVKTEGPSGDQG